MHTLSELLGENGFDAARHALLRADLRRGSLGLAQNRLRTAVRDVEPQDVVQADTEVDTECRMLGRQALEQGQVAVLTLAGGVGSRWCHGTGVVKALHAFHSLAGHDRTFLEVQLAKSHSVARQCGTPLPHVVTTSYLTHEPIQRHLERHSLFGYEGPVVLSRGRSVGLRMVPTLRDLMHWWQQADSQPTTDQDRPALYQRRERLVEWVRRVGEASDYTANTPLQCLHPLGHWYEVANLLANGTLAMLLSVRPQLQYIMLHNIDCLGAHVDAGLLGLHMQSDAALTFELTRRQPGDRGGGLARVNGRPRLVEALALPLDCDETRLSLYNSMTTWISIDALLGLFQLERTSLTDTEAVEESVQLLSRRLPTYVTIKEVTKRSGPSDDEVRPVVQCEKLWGDMSALPELACQYVVVPRQRGQQLKQPAELLNWRCDGSVEHIEGICAWQ